MRHNEHLGTRRWEENENAHRCVFCFFFCLFVLFSPSFFGVALRQPDLGGGGGDDAESAKEKEEEAERERLEAIKEAEERRKDKHRKMEEEREKMRQDIRDKVGSPNADYNNPIMCNRWHQY